MAIAERISAAFAAVFGGTFEAEPRDPTAADLPPVNFDRDPIDF